MRDVRLGDDIDDFCVRCKRVMNHAVVSVIDNAPAKVRCRTCYSDHDYRKEQAPPTKKELARQKELFNAVLAGMPQTVAAGEGAPDALPVEALPVETVAVEAVAVEPPPPALKKPRK